MKSTKNKIIVYQAKTGALEFKGDFKRETIWATQADIVKLFDKNQSVVSRHIRNIFKEREVLPKSNMQKMHNANSDKPVVLYSLDIILAVGYRTNSSRAIDFRQWATSVLRSHIVKGFTINRKLLLQQQARVDDLQKAVAFMRAKATRPGLAGQAEELLSVIQDYASSLSLFYQYDKGTLALQKNKKASAIITYDTACDLVNQTKLALIKKNEASDLFGQEYGEKFKGILGALYQTFGGKELYGTVEEKAAHLLYLVIKDHPFADGNKRVGSLLFVYFLDINKYLRRKSGERKIANTTLVALALLVAESDPKEKDVMIKLITNLLV